MNDAFSGSHPVYGTGFYFYFISERISVHYASFKQKSKRGKSDMWMWQNIKILSFVQFYWSHVIDVDEWSNHSFLSKKQ